MGELVGGGGKETCALLLLVPNFARNRRRLCSQRQREKMQQSCSAVREDIEARLRLLKPHLPHHESDHVMNLTYNAMLDGVRSHDIELRSNDEGVLNGF